MPTPRVNPDRTLTKAEKARRNRQAREAYLRAVEDALVAAADGHQHRWRSDHGLTLEHVRASIARRRE
jgi:hypothetical protein